MGLFECVEYASEAEKLKQILAEKEAEHQRKLEETKRERENRRRELEESRAKLLEEQRERQEQQKAAAEVRYSVLWPRSVSVWYMLCFNMAHV